MHTQKSPKAVKRDAETGEVAKSEQQRSRSRKEGGIVWPPGKWRLGVPCRKARYLFMRFATLGKAAGQRATVQLSMALLVQFRKSAPCCCFVVVCFFVGGEVGLEMLKVLSNLP